MPDWTKIILRLCVAMVVIAVAPTDLEAKCRDATLPGYVLIIDDRVVGEYAMHEDHSQFRPPTEEIYSLTVECRRLPSGATQALVLYTTRTGHPSLVTLHLRELAERQEAWYAGSGRFQKVSELSYYGSTARIPIEIVVSDAGWSGTVHLPELGMICHIVVGSAEPQRADLTPGVPTCFASGAPQKSL